MRLLLIEDDVSLADGMKTALKRAGYAVDHAATAGDALRYLEGGPVDIAVLDLGLPDRDGLELLGDMRRLRPELAVLILSARDQLQDKVAGLDEGADDYLTKPFAFDELLARLRVLGRRGGQIANPEVILGELRINLANHQVSLGTDALHLSRREFAILRALADRPGQILSRQQLEDKLYSWGDEVNSNTIDVHIHNLRKKLGQRFIKTVRGVGYVLDSAS